MGLCDEAADSLRGVWQSADFYILCVPVGAAVRLLPSLIDSAGPGTVIVDVGSVKEPIAQTAADSRPEFGRFVPAHPLAGNHLSGPEHGDADLLVGRRVVLPPAETTEETAVEAVEALFRSVGAKTMRMDAAEHDRLVALISHMPHLVAFASMLATGGGAGRDALDFAASGFRSFTRIAAANPEMWADILTCNGDNVRQALDALREQIDLLERAALEGDHEALLDLIGRASQSRRRLDTE